MSIDCMNRVWKQSQHEGSRLLAMLALADRANEYGVCWPGIADIAKRARTEKRHAKRVVKQLLESGEVFSEEGGGRHHTNLYLVCVGMDDGQIIDALTHRQFFQYSPLEARVALADLRTKQQAFAAHLEEIKGVTAGTVSEEESDEPDENSGAQDTLSQNSGADARKGVVQDSNGVMAARNSGADARKGVTAVTPESSLIPNEPPKNPKEIADAFWERAKTDLKGMMAFGTFNTHISAIEPLSYRNGIGPPTLRLLVRDARSLEWIQARLHFMIERVVDHVVGESVKIEYLKERPPNEN